VLKANFFLTKLLFLLDEVCSSTLCLLYVTTTALLLPSMLIVLFVAMSFNICEIEILYSVLNNLTVGTTPAARICKEYYLNFAYNISILTAMHGS